MKRYVTRLIQGQTLDPQATIVQLLAVEKEPRGPGTAFLYAFVVVVEEPDEADATV